MISLNIEAVRAFGWGSGRTWPSLEGGLQFVGGRFALAELAGDIGPEAALDELTRALSAHARTKPETAQALGTRDISANIFDTD